MLDHAEIVGDEDVGQVERALQLVQEVQDLGLDRDVQGRDRLVGDDQPGPEDQGAGAVRR